MVKRGFRVVGLLVCLCLLMVGFGGLFGVETVTAVVPVPSVVYPDLEPNATHPYILEVPFGSYDYFVGFYDNGSCYAVNMSNWDRFAISDNDSGVVQDCLDEVGAVVYMKGNFSFDYTVYYGDHDILFIEGSVTAADGMDAAIFQNEHLDGSNHDCAIIGVGKAVINGNSAGQDGLVARGIVFDQHGTEVPNLYTDYEIGYASGLTLKALDIVNCRDEGLYYNASSSSLTQSDFFDVGVRRCGLTGGVNCFIQAFTDSRWMTGLIQGDASIYGLKMFGGSFSEFGGGLYMNGKHYFYYCTGLNFHPLIMDNGGSYDTLRLEGCYGNNFHDFRMSYFGDVNATVSGIVCANWESYADCTDNLFHGITFGKVGSNFFAYGVEFDDANQDDNFCSDLFDSSGVGTDLVHVNGAVVTVADCVGDVAE